MSKISEQKALEAYQYGCHTFVESKREGYIKGYDQAMPDFLEKVERWLEIHMPFGEVSRESVYDCIQNLKTTCKMKARIKGTNIIVECIRIDGFFEEKGKGVYCKYINGEHPGGYETIPGDCLIELENDFDWQSFRAEAAKEFTAALLPVIDWEHTCNENIIKNAIDLANELIRQLKEKE